MLGKTIDEITRTDLKVKLGAKNGSAFIFCGNLKDVDADAIDEAVIAGYSKTLESAKNSIKALSSKPKDYESYRDEMRRNEKSAIRRMHDPSMEDIKRVKKKYECSENGYNRWLSDIERKLKNARETRRKKLRDITEYTSIRTRKIVEVYPSVAEDDTLILLYDGKEHGTAWDTKEYLEGAEE